jgi:chromosomal replication initiation ATPase DnaA
MCSLFVDSNKRKQVFGKMGVFVTEKGKSVMMMKPPADSYQFTSTAALKEHYAAVHKRLFPQQQKQDTKPDIYDKQVWNGVSVQEVIALVAEFYKTTIPDLLHGRVSGLVRVRYVAYFMAYYSGKRPLRNIAKIMGCHLNTVHDGIRRISDRRRRDAVLDSEMVALRAQIENRGKT